MQTLLTELAISMSEFKRNPAAVLRQARGRPVAVLSHNKVDFYVLPPGLLEQLLASTADPAEGPRAHLLKPAPAASE